MGRVKIYTKIPNLRLTRFTEPYLKRVEPINLTFPRNRVSNFYQQFWVHFECFFLSLFQFPYEIFWSKSHSKMFQCYFSPQPYANKITKKR